MWETRTWNVSTAKAAVSFCAGVSFGLLSHVLYVELYHCIYFYNLNKNLSITNLGKGDLKRKTQTNQIFGRLKWTYVT